LDLLHHLAVRALNDDHRPADALRLADQSLRQHASGAIALILRGDARAALSDCKGAEADYRRAAEFIEIGADTLYRANERDSPEGRRELADEWRARARKLECRSGFL
jgi:hypothetical protein